MPIEPSETLKTLAENRQLITDFDEVLFHSLVENITVTGGEDLVFRFRDGTEVQWRI